MKTINCDGVQYYCRQDAIKLSGASSSRLAYLDRIGLVVPTKVGKNKKPVVIYSQAQIDLVKQINTLSQWFNLSTLQRFSTGEEPLKSLMLRFLKDANP